MSLPFFFAPGIPDGDRLVLDENNSRHAVSVLRMEAGEKMHLTNGRGLLVTAEVLDPHKKKTQLQLLEVETIPPPSNRVVIGFSPLKNSSRLEWFLEKATEMGVSGIVLLQCKRTEKQQVRLDRLQQILISALLQSQQCWLPVLRGPLPFMELVREERTGQKFIAHCLPTGKSSLRELAGTTGAQLLLIGPEGDFTPDEIEAAIAQQFVPVSLGETRLRSETAAMAGAALLCLH